MSSQSPRPSATRQARALIAARLGPEQLQSLHRENALLDFMAVAGAFALFLGLAYALGVGSARSPLWWLALLAQANLVLMMAYLNHDVFVHRKRLPGRWRWLVSSLLVWPSQLRAGTYETQHLMHHRGLGTEADTESYKLLLDTALRRMLYASPAAAVLRFVIFGNRTASQSVGAQAGPPSERARFERKVWFAALAAAALAAVVDWRWVVFGYLLPLLVGTPVFNSVRLVLEHFDLQAGHPLWVGTFYRTGPVWRVLSVWGAGDCHMVHHYYPTIPFYRMGEAVDRIRPVLLEHGVREHRSLLPLLRDWFGGARPHWSVPGTPGTPQAQAMGRK